MDDARILPAKHRLTVQAFERMDAAGIFGADERIELIDGDLIDMAPIGTRHANAVNELNRSLVLACGHTAIVSIQNPVLLDDTNLPQPDLAVLRQRADYSTVRPEPPDILLVVEVADSSIHFDREVKLPLYARAGINEFWLLDLQRRTLEAHRAPVDGAFTETVTYQPGDRVALAVSPDILVQLGPVFG